MKKTLLLLLLFSVTIYGQNATPFTNIKLTANVKDNEATRMLVQDTLTKKISWVLKSTVGKLKSVTGTDGVTVALGETTPVIGLGNIRPISVNATGIVLGSNLTNIDNTSDVNKRVSNATQIALDFKSPLDSPIFTGTVGGITKAMIGLPLAENTTDLNKPVSIATKNYLDLKENLINKTSSLTASAILYPNNNSVIAGLSALDATVVHNTRPELIAGEKTFSDKLVVIPEITSFSFIKAYGDLISLANISAIGNISSQSNINSIGTITGSNFIKTNGLSSQNLLADGSVFDVYNKSISSSVYFQNSTLNSTLISGMTITPPLAGTYKVDYNGQFDIVANITQQALLDLNALFLNLNGLLVTNTVFPAFTTDTTILPGVYSSTAAVLPNGLITFDGRGNSNSTFIFKIGGAITVGAGCVFNLVNGATANNIFFVCNAAISLGANSNTSGTFITPSSAIGLTPGAFLTGRVLTLASAITSGGSISIPTLPSQFPMGVSTSFAMFSGSGIVSNVGANIIVGDIGTNLGAISGFELATLTGSIYLPGQVGSTCKFSIYVDDVIVPTSTRERINAIAKTDVVLSDSVTTTAGQTIAIKVTNSTGISRFYNRNLSITKY